MIYKVFNTAFETALRITLLLSVSESDLDKRTIQTADFLATYGKTFSLSNQNINGENRYMYCELAARKGLVDEALKMLVRKGYVLPSMSNAGFSYGLLSQGQAFACSIVAEYAADYKNAAFAALGHIQANGIDSIFADGDQR